MQATISATALRANIFQILEESFQTGDALTIKLKNKFFSLIPQKKVLKKKFSLSDISGNPNVIIGKDDLDTYITPTEWNEPNLL